MAYCATVTFHDAAGEALQTLRYGAVPTTDPLDLCDRLLADATAIQAHHPDLVFVSLCDGAPELRALLRTAELCPWTFWIFALSASLGAESQPRGDPAHPRESR